MKKKIGAFIIFFTAIFAKTEAQQIFVFSQSMFNQYVFNPAVVGNNENPVCNMAYRQLWTGFKDSPSEQLLSVQSKISDKAGLGAKICRATTGPLSKSVFELTYAYRASLGSGNNTLSLGLSALLYEYAINENKIKLENPNDNAYLKSSDRLIVPDANFGAYLHNEKYYFGIAIQQLTNRKTSMLNSSFLKQRQVRHYFVNAGYSINVSEDVDIKPSALFKAIEEGVTQSELNLLATYKKAFSFGLGYRDKYAFSIMVHMEKSRISFGYSYDIIFSGLKKFSRGSHEIGIAYKFIKASEKE